MEIEPLGGETEAVEAGWEVTEFVSMLSRETVEVYVEVSRSKVDSR